MRSGYQIENGVRAEFSGLVVEFTLMAKSQNENFIPPGREPVEGYVPGTAIGNHELAQIIPERSSDHRVPGKNLDSAPNGADGI